MLRFLLFKSFVFSFAAHAVTSTDTELLAKSSHWLTLGQYERSLWGGYVSRVRSSEFFLSPSGATDPRAELEATIDALGKEVSGDPNRHAQCRFPARLNWIRQQIPNLAPPTVQCPDYESFSFKGTIESVSLVFATGYLSNPASYFGHPLIKFNLPRQKIRSSLLDTAVNYGALTPPRENPFVYAAKGLFGGYHAAFSHRQFYFNTHAYGEIELRDLWEYQLNLTPDEVREFYSRTWEVLGKYFPYLFISQNCASAIAQMAEDVTGVRLIPRSLPYSFPYTVFDNLMTKRRPDGQPLVTSVKLVPSRQTRLIARYRKLDNVQKRAVKAVANHDRLTEEYKTLPTEKRSDVIETLFDYYAFRTTQELADRGRGDSRSPFDGIKHELLTDRLNLPARTAAEEIGYDLRPPHEGPRPLLTRLGGFQSMKYGGGVEYQMRFAYYDFLSIDDGRAKDSEVRGFELIFDHADDKTWLRKWDLISVSTLGLSKTGLPGDGGWAWQFNTGFESLNLACTDCTAFKFEGGFGKALALADRHSVYAMLDGRAQTLTAGSGPFAVTPKVGAFINWLGSGAVKSELMAGYREYVDSRGAEGAALFKAETRFGASRGWDVRAAYEKHVDERYGLFYSRYW